MSAEATARDLASKQCKPCSEDGVRTPALPQDEINTLLQQLDGWELHEYLICKTFEFKDFYQTMAFVNAVAWISHRENHHPEIIVSYRKCRLEYSTHAINGLSENDFICASKVEALFKT
jgi:4a-hydroxytetrahydrobiopterin dehydratase